MSNAIISTIALTCIPHISRRQALEIYKHLNHDVEPLFTHSHEVLRKLYPDISPSLLTALIAGKVSALEKAKKESFIGTGTNKEGLKSDISSASDDKMGESNVNNGNGGDGKQEAVKQDLIDDKTNGDSK